jgi:phosphatidylserine/phosphatidylglycerophosphate/cardiolipin synthase-like enzyme
VSRFAFAGSLVGILSLLACAPLSHDEDVDTSTAALASKPFEGTCSPGGRICAYFAPTDMPIHAVVSAMKRAQHTIRIATYNINIPEIATVLRERMDHGVKVELMEDYAHAVEDDPDPNSVWSKVGQHPNLVKYKLSVLRGGNPQMHDKILVVDSERVFFGSANWTFTGLVGNFENVMAIKDPAVVAKYEAELDELRDLAKLTCETFGTSPAECGKGNEVLSPEYHRLAMEGAFAAAPAGPIDATKPGCNVLTNDRDGLLLPGNQPRIADPSAFQACFVDAALGAKYAAFVAKAAAIEKYADGTQVKSEPPVLENGKLRFKHADQQTGPVRVYFSGEDDVEWVMLKELRALESAPSESFAYLSTNFVTNSRLASEIAKLNQLGVRTRVFFDRGRFYDPNFTSQFYLLSKMGFTKGLGSPRLSVTSASGGKWTIADLPEHEDEESLAKSAVSVFDNDLSGNYGADHNKFAVIGTKNADGTYRVRLINGSANWSGAAMDSNDENLVVVDDAHAAAIYLREMISQLYVYRYGQNEQSAGLLADMAFVAQRVPCFDAVMGKPNAACTEPSGAPWQPDVSGALVMAVKNVPVGLDYSRRVWAWVPDYPGVDGAPAGRAFELFSYGTFEGKWVTSIPAAPGTNVRWKFFSAPASVDPNHDGLDQDGMQWEYGGIHNDRTATVGSRPLLTIRSSSLWWGSP